MKFRILIRLLLINLWDITSLAILLLIPYGIISIYRLVLIFSQISY